MNSRLLGLMVVGGLAVVPALGQTPAKAPPAQFFTGKVIPLAAALEKHGVRLDKDAAALAMATDDGKIHLLLKDDGARMFFKDKRLLERPMRLTGRLVPGTSMLQVTAVHSVVKGKLHDVYYWCDECMLRYTEPGQCTCCGAEVELIEEPLP